MSFDKMKVDLWFDRFDQRFQAVPGIVAETAVEYYKERMIQKNWDGVPWQPYKNKKREPSKGSLMMRTNNLFSSIRPSVVTAARVVVSAGSGKVGYARVHNEGLQVSGVRYVRPFTNSNFMGKGKRVQIQAHSRSVNFKMPKRQFIGASNALNKRIMERLKNQFK